MILARIAQQLRRQDWAAITIELLIVVFGVFIGLQVNNWNEMRRDQVREHEYLVRIHADLETTLERRSAPVKQRGTCAPSPLPLLSPDRGEAVLAAARRHVSEASYFAWLDAIKPFTCLEISSARCQADSLRFSK